MRKRIFLRTFLISLFSVLLMLVSGLTVAVMINNRMISERLVAETRLATALIDGEGDFDSLEVFYDNDECRITIMELNGDVIYDSDTTESLGNHIDRAEVVAALNGEPTAVQRWSDTFDCTMTYYATRAEFSDGREVIVRLAVKGAEIDDYVISSIPFLVAALLISALVSAVFARRLSANIADQVTEISHSLRSINEGNYTPIRVEDGDPELTAVLSEINGLNSRTVSNLQRERELAQRKEEFFANASHELKTPLTAMLGLTELALDGAEDEPTRQRLSRIHKETTRLSDLIADMLKLSRLESAERRADERVSVRVHEVVRDVISELSGAIRAKQITATVVGEGSILASESRIYALVENLLSNAVNYNKQGGTITVTISQIIKEDGTEAGLRLSVEDTGIGIAEEHIPHLCERFYRVDKSRSKKTGGTGLGLAIVKHVCAIEDATIAVESKMGVGTCFTVVFDR